MSFAWNGHVVVLMVFKDPLHTRWQIDSLRGQGVHVVLHVDAKSLRTFAQGLPMWAALPGVTIVPQPVRVNWAGFSQVRAILSGVNLAMAQLTGFTHLHLMSGECLPLRSFEEMGRLWAAEYPDADLIECRLRPGYEWRINRFNPFGESPHNREHWHNQAFKWARNAQLRWLPPRSNFPAGEVWFGSSWWSLRASSVRKMLAGVDLDDFCNKFRWTRCADEHFFQILHRRAGLGAAGTRRLDRFSPGASSPDYLGLDDLGAARATGHFFARKIKPEVARAFQSH
jgi:hypothetical protein